jgi:hypothetical protein
MKDERLTARVSPALHTLALHFGSQSAALRAAILITAASLDYDMRLYADDVRAVLGDELAPEVARAIHSIYVSLSGFTAPVRQESHTWQSSGNRGPGPTRAPEEPREQTATSAPQATDDPLIDVGVSV